MRSKNARFITGLMAITAAAGTAAVPAAAAEQQTLPDGSQMLLAAEMIEEDLETETAEESEEVTTLIPEETAVPEETEETGEAAPAPAATLAAADRNAVSSVLGEEAIAVNKKSASLVVAAPAETLDVHLAASEDAEVVGKLYSNDVATLLDDDGSEWLKIKSGDVVGYVDRNEVLEGEAADSLAQLTKQKVATVTTESGRLRVREGAGTDYDIVTKIHSGDQVDVIEEGEDWIKVATTSGEGYISAEYASVETSYPTGETIDVVESRSESAYESLEDAKTKAMRAQNVLDKAETLLADAAQDSTAKTVLAAAKNAADVTTAIETEAQETYDESFSGQAVVDYAMQFLGNPYVYGGTSLTNGCDCSGFTMSVYAHFGVSLPHYDASQRSCGTAVSSLAEARPGDLICYYGHVAIYMGDGKIIHASNHRDGIKISNNAGYRTIAAIRRIFT